MKANEIKDGKDLMIGDLIFGCIETDKVGEATYKIPCKVTGIDDCGDVICEPLKSFPDELDWQEGDDFSWIESIPLTPEILEKNGFERTELGFYCYLNDDTNCRIMYYPKDRNYTHGSYNYADIDSGCIDINELPLEFVHELQHVLRLCYLTELADNFKVG